MKERLTALISTAEGWIKLSIGVVTFVGILWGGMVGLNAYLSTQYALAKEFNQHKQDTSKEFSETKVLILKQDARGLRQEKYGLEDTKERRPLLESERKRLREVTDDLNDLNSTIKSLETK